MSESVSCAGCGRREESQDGETLSEMKQRLHRSQDWTIWITPDLGAFCWACTQVEAWNRDAAARVRLAHPNRRAI